MNSATHNVLPLKDQLIDKEKLIEKQKRLAEQRNFLKDKFKSVTERKPTAVCNPLTKVDVYHKNDDSIDELSTTTSLGQKKTYNCVPLSNSESRATTFGKSINSTSAIERQLKPRLIDNTESTSTLRQQNIKTVLQPDDESIVPLKPKSSGIGTCVSQENSKFQMTHQSAPPKSPSKYQKLNKNTSKNTKFESKREKYNGKKLPKNISKPIKENKFFSASVVDNYLKNSKSDSFELPNDEYKNLMKIKSSVENSQSRINELLQNDLPKKNKCFYRMTPLLESKDDDGPITECHINKNYLILIHRDAINVYFKKETENKKEWIFKDSMRKLRFKDVLKEMIICCNIKKKETIMLCQIHITGNEQLNKQSFIKMAQYRFLEENGKVMKEYTLGSFDCALEKLRCCHIVKKQCCIAITGWNVARSRTVGWVFTYSEVNDTMKCGAMVPLKHEVESLHDVSLSTYRNVLLAFGRIIFTIWNAKTGERLSCCSLETISPNPLINCHFGCFATIQKGFLFILANTEDTLHMIATNLDTEVSKSLRKFKLPRYNKCIAVSVKDDKLVGLMDKSIVCWSLKNTLRLQQIRLEDGETPFLNKSKILIATQNKIKKILTIKSDSNYREDIKNKIRELMTSESTDSQSIPVGATANDI